MRSYILAISLLLSLSSASANEYIRFDARNLTSISKTANGKSATLNLAYLDQVLLDLASHAGTYPTQFDSTQERQHAIEDTKNLLDIFDGVLASPALNDAMLRRAGFCNTIAYNLDIPGTDSKISAIYMRLFASNPDHPGDNLQYGTFLTNSGKPKQALPFLEKAVAGGLSDANRILGMAWLILGDKEQALSKLETYLKNKPDDNATRILINGVRNGKIQYTDMPQSK